MIDNRDILNPENMSYKVKCEVCGAIVPKGESLYYRRKNLRYCNYCKNIDLKRKLRLAGRR